MSRNEKNVPDPEVVPVAERRQFNAAYKLRILKEADQCTEPGELGALLRREGLYSSYLSRWRRAPSGCRKNWRLRRRSSRSKKNSRIYLG